MNPPSAPRIHLDRPLAAGEVFDLPQAQARHVQVLRLQPGSALSIFNGRGGEWRARVEGMGRAGVGVRIEAFDDVERELPRQVTLALGMPANERMDTLIEKATELGVAAIQPLLCERSVLRLSGERAVRRLAHWRGVAGAAAEQSGRTRLPVLHEVASLRDWLDGAHVDPADVARRFMLSPAASRSWRPDMAGEPGQRLVFLSGPEGGLSPAEERAASDAGYMPVSLGERVLRADTAPLVVLAWCSLESNAGSPA